MNGKWNSGESWEKQSVFDLENGWQATVSHSVHYGEFISRLDSPDRKTYWHCSNGIAGLPEFARVWLKGGDNWITKDLLQVKFIKQF